MDYQAEIDRIIRLARSHHLAAQDQAERKIIHLYQKAADDVGKIILSYGPEAENIGMYYQLREDLQERIRKLSDDVASEFHSLTEQEAARGIRSAAESAYGATGGIVGMLPQAEFSRVYWEAVRAMSVTVDGIALSDKIWQINQVSLQAMREILLESMVSGQNFSMTYQRMKQYLRLNQVNLRSKYWKEYFKAHPPGRGVYRSAWKNTLRVIRTESNRAFREGAQLYAQGKTWVKGMRWNLSAAHPEIDICDELASADTAGLGSGVYPVGACPTSGHPHCICYVTMEIDPAIVAGLAA